MTWRYGLIKTFYPEADEYEYSVHEIYDTAGGSSWTVNPISFYGSSRDQVESALLQALNDIRRETDDEIEARHD